MESIKILINLVILNLDNLVITLMILGTCSYMYWIIETMGRSPHADKGFEAKRKEILDIL